MADSNENNQFFHIISASFANIKRFGAKAIHNQMNVMPLHVEIIRQMTAHYNSLKDPSKSLTVRQWLSTQLLTEQFQYGTTYMQQMLNKLLEKGD